MTTIALVMTVAAAGCGSGGGSGSANGPDSASVASTTTPPTSATATGPATNFTLRITNVHLLNSEETDNALRVQLPGGVTTASVTLAGLPSPNQVISVCQAATLDQKLPAATCRNPTNGQAVSVPLGPATPVVEIDQVGVSGAGAQGNTTAIDQVTIEYTASSRQLNVRLPQVAANDVGPAFALTPASTDGRYQASLSWTVILTFGGAAATGQLELVQGGTVTNQASAGADVKLTGNVPPPVGDVAIRVRNPGAAALVAPHLTMTLP
jgi:hypothetical protein